MLTPWRKSYNQSRQHIKNRDITLPTKVHLVKAMVFPVAMYGYESQTIKKAEHWRIDAFELWFWRKLLRVPWTAQISTQSILKEISPEYSLKGLMLKLKLQYLAAYSEKRTHLKRPWCWKRLKAGGEGDDRGRDGWMASRTQWRWVWVNSGRWWWTGRPGMLRLIHGVAKSRTRLSNWTELNPSDTSKCGCHALICLWSYSYWVLQLFHLFAFFCLLEFLRYLVSQEQVSFTRHVSHLLLLIEFWISGTIIFNSFLLLFSH